MKLTKAQQIALKQIYDRKANTNPPSYLQFRRQVQLGPGCVMILWAGMWLGIELDGYSHS